MCGFVQVCMYFMYVCVSESVYIFGVGMSECVYGVCCVSVNVCVCECECMWCVCMCVSESVCESVIVYVCV